MNLFYALSVLTLTLFTSSVSCIELHNVIQTFSSNSIRTLANNTFTYTEPPSPLHGIVVSLDNNNVSITQAPLPADLQEKLKPSVVQQKSSFIINEHNTVFDLHKFSNSDNVFFSFNKASFIRSITITFHKESVITPVIDGIVTSEHTAAKNFPLRYHEGLLLTAVQQLRIVFNNHFHPLSPTPQVPSINGSPRGSTSSTEG